ncbi:MAG: lipid 3-deoxy-D-manno-octulosonic acid transferase [Flavipsychrobacter sp.]|nr:lipid 3-deoxy-D-manno-octulosonic acid transferase [Flavipsychrobacter sp.]
MILHTLIYRLGIGAYTTAIRIAALFNAKAKLFIEGRKGLLPKIKEALSGEKRPRIWMHCASLGEFEQGRPVLDELRSKYPHYAIVVTFFSPSGYEIRKDYPGADHVFYLPMDTRHNANEFLDIVQPVLCLFVKYEFWYYYLSAIASRHIPVLLISAVFVKEQGFFKWYGGLQRSMLRCFSHIFVQDSASLELLKSIKINNTSIGGDTRFDRVITAAGRVEDLPLAAHFANGHKVLIAGSTWKEDEQFLHKVINLLPSSWKVIIVPHEVDNEHISNIETLFSNTLVKWSDCQNKSADLSVAMDGKRVLLVDKVGFLLQLYRYGTVAWIGGGFGKEGVHNVLEAAVYGMPCFYGPVFHQFIEAKELIHKGGAFTTSDPPDLVSSIKELDDELRYKQHATAAREYVLSGSGATGKIMAYIGQFVPGKL